MQWNLVLNCNFRQKAQYLRHLVDIGLKIRAGYGSAKDVPVGYFAKKSFCIFQLAFGNDWGILVRAD